jgi:hypothetical protein
VELDQRCSFRPGLTDTLPVGCSQSGPQGGHALNTTGRRRTDMTTPDLNQLTISGRVEHGPELHDPTTSCQPVASIIVDNITTLRQLGERSAR